MESEVRSALLVGTTTPLYKYIDASATVPTDTTILDIEDAYLLFLKRLVEQKQYTLLEEVFRDVLQHSAIYHYAQLYSWCTSLLQITELPVNAWQHIFKLFAFGTIKDYPAVEVHWTSCKLKAGHLKKLQLLTILVKITDQKIFNFDELFMLISIKDSSQMDTTSSNSTISNSDRVSLQLLLFEGSQNTLFDLRIDDLRNQIWLSPRVSRDITNDRLQQMSASLQHWMNSTGSIMNQLEEQLSIAEYTAETQRQQDKQLYSEKEKKVRELREIIVSKQAKLEEKRNSKVSLAQLSMPFMS